MARTVEKDKVILKSIKTKKSSHKIPEFIIFYLRIISLITFGLGFLLIFWPNQMISIFFRENSSNVEFFIRMLGSTLVGYASLNALASYRAVKHSVDVAIWANLVTLVVASFISLTYAHNFDGFAWLMISQHVIFALGFAYCAIILNRSNKLAIK